MNAIDRLVAAVDPEKAVNRAAARKRLEVMNSGYGEHGANHHKKSVIGWITDGGSSKEDIEDNLPTLRERSRDLYMGAPLAASAIKTYRTSVIGEGLSLKPKVDAEFLGISEEQASALESNILREWQLWADSTDCDASRINNFYELQQLAFMNWLLSGDVLATLPTWKRPGSVYDLRINLIEADRCRTPAEKALTKTNWGFDKIVDGVERNQRGEVVAYWFSKNHPKGRGYLAVDAFTRVSAYGRRTGRRNVLHLQNRERIGQVRGVPLLAPVIETIKQMDRYTDAEIVAAVVQGYFTVFIEHENTTAGEPLGKMIPEQAQVDAGDPASIEMGNGAIIDLGPGEKANPATPGRPNASFDGFVTAICKQIGSALELPQELLLKQFTASYSASRGALLEAWKTFDMYRDWMASGFCEPIYEEWLAEAVAKGRIAAPGFFSDPAIRQAYSRSEWYGPSRGQLDPKKEVESAALRVQYGFSTATKESMEMTGTDFTDNMAQRKQEIALMRDATGESGWTTQTGQNEEAEDEEDEDE